MKRCGKANVVLALLIASGFVAQCGLSDGADKNRCQSSRDCLAGRLCVDGRCRTGASGAGSEAGTSGAPQGGTGGAGEAGDSGDAGSDAGGGSDSTGTGGATDSGGTSGDTSGGTGGSSVSGNGGLGGGAVCPSMVRMPDGWCIDSTEVTRDDYTAWLATSPAPSTNAACGWNTSLQPRCTWSAGTGNHPATCIDWCDAYSYCEGAEKRLCGDPGGGPTPYASFADQHESQWYAACSSEGRNTYVYGNSVVEGRCVDNSVSTNVLPVGSKPACQAADGSYDCIFDLNGNAWEWEDSCEVVGATTNCRLRGGSYSQGAGIMTCGYNGYTDITTAETFNNIGFRCCSATCP